MQTAAIVSTVLLFQASKLMPDNNLLRFGKPAFDSPPKTNHDSELMTTPRHERGLMSDIGTCEIPELTPKSIDLFLLDDGQRGNVDVINLGSSIPSEPLNLDELDPTTAEDIADDQFSYQRLLEQIGSIGSFTRSFFIQQSTLDTLNGDFYQFGPSDSCDTLGNCFGDDLPYGPNHARNSAIVLTNAIGEELIGMVNFFADEVSTCWLQLASLHNSLDKVEKIITQTSSNSTVVVIPAGTGVKSAVEENADQVNCNDYESITSKVQSLKDANPNTVVLAAAGTKPPLLNSGFANLLIRRFINFLDISNSCITPANSPNIVAIAPVNADGRCSSTAWPAKGNENADFAYWPAPNGLHTVSGENTSSGASTHFAGDFIRTLQEKVQQHLPEEAQKMLMDAVFATLDPIVGNSENCGKGIANLDAAFEYLLDFYDVSLPMSTPTKAPSTSPTEKPSVSPSSAPMNNPSMKPSEQPSEQSSLRPTEIPTKNPSASPSNILSTKPTVSEQFNPPTQAPATPPESDASGALKHTTATLTCLMVSAFFAVNSI